MEELIEKIEQLKNSLDTTKEVKKIKSLQEKIKSDQQLCQLLVDYQKYPTEEKKLRIYNHKLFQEYKESENEINLLIWNINNTLGNIKNRDEL